jgi:membrane protein DedA with SNARE-associated domain
MNDTARVVVTRRGGFLLLLLILLSGVLAVLGFRTAQFPLPLPAFDSSLDPWVQMVTIILSTFVSEDLTCIAAGLFIHDARLDLLTGLLGCFLGIFLGDLGLWLIGRLAGRGLLRWKRLESVLPARRLEELEAWFDRRGWAAVLAARFLPGTRLPLYLAAGVLGRKAGRFALWAALACLLWTPLLVFATALAGPAIIGPFHYHFGPGWPALALGALALLLMLRLPALAGTPVGRGKLIARVAWLWRWEFWPSWLFYLPVLPWLAYLSLRHRGPLVWTAANPGIPHGGVVGESKYAILAALPARWIAPSLFIPPGEFGLRVRIIERALAEGWAFPLILKPDASQRGAGVKRVWDRAGVEDYLREQPAAVVAQIYHPGPYEAGIFYYRLPGEPTGRIFSVTDKVFPVLVGDGRSTLEELLWQHPRFRMQAATFLKRHAQERDRILARGEGFPLVLAGNHCQGTMFRDGAHLITPDLERVVDAIARHFPGFFIGRFDVRYSDLDAFKAGRDLSIVELNGATSESTNLYDPSWSLLAAYRTLFRQWALLYAIGAANRDRGYSPTTIRDLIRLLRDYYRERRIDPLAD